MRSNLIRLQLQIPIFDASPTLSAFNGHGYQDGTQDKMDRSYDRVQRVNCGIKTSRFAALMKFASSARASVRWSAFSYEYRLTIISVRWKLASKYVITYCQSEHPELNFLIECHKQIPTPEYPWNFEIYYIIFHRND